PPRAPPARGAARAAAAGDVGARRPRRLRVHRRVLDGRARRPRRPRGGPMHPVIAKGAPRRALAAAALALAALVGGGCAHEHVPVPEPTAIEQLRVRITKTRHAIRETQATIVRSKGSPHLPELYVRLAELLSEEARYHNEVAYERE